tara:strand:- start:2401 stop:2943 length:543 start_codon:yes stop_codon:yes gene_type:complete
MAIPDSGAVTLNDLQSNLGGSSPIGISEYYKGSAILPINVGGASAVPTSGTISLDDFYSLPTNLAYTQGSSILVTNTGNPSNRPSLDISSYLTGKQRTVGNTFTIVTYPNAGSFWAYYAPFVTTFTYGTAQTFQSPSTGGKSTYRQTIYNGAGTITLYSYYSGGSTNYKESGCYISEIRY